MMVITSLLILLITEKDLPVVALLFEITSAFGTCGMSLGITSDLSVVGKLIIMVAHVHRAGGSHLLPLYTGW